MTSPTLRLRIAGHRVVALLLLVVVASSMAVALAPTAGAHSRLVSAAPEAGSTLEAAPTEVVLTFNEKVNPNMAAVKVTGPDGSEVTDGDNTVDNSVVTQPLVEDLAGGEYTVTFRVVSADGHPVADTYTFTVVGPAATAPSTAVAPTTSTAPVTTDTGPATDPTPSTPATTNATPTTALKSSDDGSGMGRWPWVIGVLIVIAVAGYALTRNRHH